MRLRWAFAIGAAVAVAIASPALAGPKDDLAAAIALEGVDAARAKEALTRLAADRGTPDARDVAARASFRLGELEERALRYADALARYRDVLAIDPGNYVAGAARARIDVLSSYAALDELARLDVVRKDPAKAADRAAIEALANDVVAFRDARLRAEALLFVAHAWDRMGATSRAVDAALSAAHATGAPDWIRASAWDLAWAVLRRTGQLDRARQAIADDPAAPSDVRARVSRELRRRALHRASVFVSSAGLGALIVAASVALRRGRLGVVRKALLRPSAIAFLVLTPVFGGLVAHAWDKGLGAPFAAFGVCLLAVHALVSAWRGAFGDQRRTVRLVGGLTAAACVIAAAYLVLERGEAYGTPLLDGFGL